MIKKILKIVGVLVLLLVILAFAIPYFFKDEIKAKIAKSLNENLNATAAFKDADLSLFKNFPNATVTLDKFSIVNKAPFVGDTLVSVGELSLKMSVMELFKKSNEQLIIDGLSSKNGLINIIFNKDGVGNYDIALKDAAKDNKSASNESFSFKLSQYNIENFKFKYTDEASDMRMVLDSINHSGVGDFNKQILDLNTKTTAKVSLDMAKVNYLKNINITLDAVLGIDLKKSKYTFKQNKAKINELPLEFDGFIQLVDAGQEYDLKFKTPTSSFKNFLGLIPSAYSSSLDNVKTSGDFTVVGFAKGLLSDTTVPKFKIDLASNNATFQYPDLPKSVKNIMIDAKIINETGVMNDTYVNLDKLSFSIDQDVFNAKASIKNVATNALVDAVLKGTINLANLSKAYPIKLDKPLSGILKADVTTKFDMESVEKSQYEKINNAGNLQLSAFKYTDENGKGMNISNAMVQFNPSRVNLQEFKATTGKSDISVTGVLNNFYGFLFRNQNLEGDFVLNSNQIAVDDFMTSSSDSKVAKKPAEAMKIPAFLDCTLSANATTVLYDNLTLKNVSGKLIVKDQAVTLQNVKSNIFGGSIGVNGMVSTKAKTPTFSMDLGLTQVDIAQTFTQLDMLKKIAPIAGIINGKLNSSIKLSGNMKENEMTPNLSTITGDLVGQLLSTTVNSSNSTLLTALDNNLNFIDLKKLNLNDLKAALTFKDGKVTVKPFDLKYQDIKATVGGSHGFDQVMNYTIKLDVPAKYLGNDINNLIAKLTPIQANKLEFIPINAMLSGSFSQPKVSTDIKAATTTLVTNLVNQQKAALINKGTSALSDLLNKNKKSGDTTKTVTPATKEEVKAEIKTQIQTQANDLLNGLFGKKKKKDTIK